MDAQNLKGKQEIECHCFKISQQPYGEQLRNMMQITVTVIIQFKARWVLFKTRASREGAYSKGALIGRGGVFKSQENTLQKDLRTF